MEKVIKVIDFRIDRTGTETLNSDTIMCLNIKTNIEELKELFSGIDMLFLISSGEDETDIKAILFVLNIAKTLQIVTIVISVCPFPFEGRAKRSMALENIGFFEKESRYHVVVSSEKVEQTFFEDISIKDCFLKLNEKLLEIMTGISSSNCIETKCKKITEGKLCQIKKSLPPTSKQLNIMKMLQSHPYYFRYE